MSEYCPICHKVILQPDMNYGINPDAVCRCPWSEIAKAREEVRSGLTVPIEEIRKSAL